MIQWRSRRSGTRTYTCRPSQMETVSSVIICTMRPCPLAAKAARRSEQRAGAVPFSPRRVMWGTSCLMSSFITWHVKRKYPKKPQIGMLAILAAPAKKKKLGLPARRRKVVIPRFRVNHRSRSAAVWRLGALACFLTSLTSCR